MEEGEEAEERGESSAAVVAKAVDISQISVAEAEEVERSQQLIDAFEQSIATLKQCGALNACTALQNEIRKEKRRQRNMSKINTAVAVALVRRREWEANEARRRRQLEIDATNNMRKTRADAQKEAAQAKALLQKRKLQIAQLEATLSTKQELKRFPPESLGQGHAKGCGAAGRKLRHEVLDRMSRTGVGLSADQKKRLGVVQANMGPQHARSSRGGLGRHVRVVDAESPGGRQRRRAQRFLSLCVQ